MGREPHALTGSCALLLLHDEPHGRAHTSPRCKTRLQHLSPTLTYLRGTAQEHHNRVRQRRDYFVRQMGPALYFFAHRLFEHMDAVQINIQHLKNREKHTGSKISNFSWNK